MQQLRTSTIQWLASHTLHAERVGDRWTVSVEGRGPIRRYITTQGIDPSQRPR